MPSWVDPVFGADALRYCGWLTRTARSNFSGALRLLPRGQRQAMEAVYAFCRVVDDAVDQYAVPGTVSVPGTDPRREIAAWRREVAACEGGYPSHPVAVALQPVMRRYGVPASYLNALIDGVEMDLDRRRYATFAELKVYCEHVASVVGLISVRVFGCRHPAVDRYAENLGIALQLTNIMRDLRTDMQRGRIYIPQEELARFGYSEEDLANARLTDAFRKLMEFQHERARSFFKEAEAALRESREARKLLPARIMGGVYASLLDRIGRLEYDVFSARPSVPLGERAMIAARCLLF